MPVCGACCVGALVCGWQPHGRGLRLVFKRPSTLIKLYLRATMNLVRPQSKKYAIEKQDGEKIVSRRKGITVDTCVGALAAGKEGPGFQTLPGRDKVGQRACGRQARKVLKAKGRCVRSHSPPSPPPHILLPPHTQVAATGNEVCRRAEVRAGMCHPCVLPVHGTAALRAQHSPTGPAAWSHVRKEEDGVTLALLLSLMAVHWLPLALPPGRGPQAHVRAVLQGQL